MSNFTSTRLPDKSLVLGKFSIVAAAFFLIISAVACYAGQEIKPGKLKTFEVRRRSLYGEKRRTEIRAALPTGHPAYKSPKIIIFSPVHEPVKLRRPNISLIYKVNRRMNSVHYELNDGVNDPVELNPAAAADIHLANEIISRRVRENPSDRLFLEFLNFPEHKSVSFLTSLEMLQKMQIKNLYFKTSEIEAWKSAKIEKTIVKGQTTHHVRLLIPGVDNLIVQSRRGVTIVREFIDRLVSRIFSKSSRLNNSVIMTDRELEVMVKEVKQSLIDDHRITADDLIIEMNDLVIAVIPEVQFTIEMDTD